MNSKCYICNVNVYNVNVYNLALDNYVVCCSKCTIEVLETSHSLDSSSVAEYEINIAKINFQRMSFSLEDAYIWKRAIDIVKNKQHNLEAKEAPCKNCSRVNDCGIKKCWYCEVANPC